MTIKHLIKSMSILLLVISMFILTIPQVLASGGVLLDDKFDDGDIATNTRGIGNGFKLNWFDYWGGTMSAVESDGQVTVSGSALSKAIVSNDAINPTGTTLTWVITDRPGGIPTWVPGVIVGWVKDGAYPFTYCAVLELRDDRVVFDIDTLGNWEPAARYIQILRGSTTPNEVYTGDFVSPVTVSIYMDATNWRADVTGQGVDIHKSGTYNPGHSLNDLLAVSGGTLRAEAAVGVWNDTGSFDSVLVTTSAATKADVLIGSGVTGKGLSDAPGLQKPFNPNSQAADNAGKKK